jgi:hypothetical protein
MFSDESARTFDAMKDDLIRSFPGQFALVCGRRLVGVYPRVDDALLAASRAFEAEDLPAGAPILIAEIAAQASVRVMATPFRRAAAAP